MKIESYDFRKPSRLAGDLEQRSATWIQSSCTLFSEKCVKKLALQLEAGLRGTETARPTDALARFSDAVVAYRILVNAEELVTLLVLPRPLALGLVAGVLGDALPEPPADRELTLVDASLCEMLLQHWAAGIQEGWAAAQPITVALGRPELYLKRCRLFPPDENLVVCALTIRASFGTHEFHWLVPQPGLTSLFSRPADSGSSQADTRRQLEVLMQEAPVEVSVKLGSVELHVSQLAHLRAGDVVILDQPVFESLTAAIDGRTRYRVWPGRVGPRQAVQIESIVGG